MWRAKPSEVLRGKERSREVRSSRKKVLISRVCGRAFAGLDSFEEQFLDREAITRELVKFAMQQRDKEDSNDREERPASMANKGLGNPTD